MILQAEGESDAIRMKAQAQAEAIATIALALSKADGLDAAKLNIAREVSQLSE